MKRQLYILIGLLIAAAHPVQAATTDDADDAALQPRAVYSEELQVFDSVADGIELMLAVCQFQADCTYALSETEIEQLQQALDDRITQLDMATGAEAVTHSSLLDEFRETRQQYALYMREIQDINRAIEDGTFFADEFVEPEVVVEEEDDLWELQHRHEGVSLQEFQDADELLPFD